MANKFLKTIKAIFTPSEPRKQYLFIILIAFIFAFLMARAYSVYYVRSIFFRGYHIHHFYFGMIVASVGGVMGILSNGKRQLQAASILMGIGMGLFADEIGLLLNCTTEGRLCAYAFPDISDIIISISIVLMLVIIILHFVEEYYSKRRRS